MHLGGTRDTLMPRSDVCFGLQKVAAGWLYWYLPRRYAIHLAPQPTSSHNQDVGGSHDRTDLLPLKAGVAIMALGALAATPGLKVAIMPVGMSYFHAHRFRSRAVIEFGSPIYIQSDIVEQFNKGGQDKRDAIARVLELIFDGLKSVTVLAPDYETLMVGKLCMFCMTNTESLQMQLIQATRRLYRPAGQQLSLGQVVELNRRFIIGYERYKNEPRVIALKAKVQDYNKLLAYMGLRDHQVCSVSMTVMGISYWGHQVDSVDRPAWKSLLLLVYRSVLVTAWGLVALPGVILNAPMFIACTMISRKKAKGWAFFESGYPTGLLKGFYRGSSRIHSQDSS